MVLVMGAGGDRLHLSDGFDDGVDLVAAAELPYAPGGRTGWSWKAWSRCAVIRQRPRLALCQQGAVAPLRASLSLRALWAFARCSLNCALVRPRESRCQLFQERARARPGWKFCAAASDSCRSRIVSSHLTSG